MKRKEHKIQTKWCHGADTSSAAEHESLSHHELNKLNTERLQHELVSWREIGVCRSSEPLPNLRRNNNIKNPNISLPDP